MKANILKISLLLIGLLSISIFFLNETKEENENKRWYSQDQVILGKEVFANNCASCHGYKAEKTINWKKTLPDGSYPPPPLNDKAHAWHHPYEQMMRIITNGGSSYGGNMPAFGDKLTLEEKEAAISYFQSFWPDETYKIWLEFGGVKSSK